MMKIEKILLASGNRNKYDELRSKLSGLSGIELLSPLMFGITLDVDESGTSLDENSALKADAFFKLLRIPALADDTGLFVNALGGKPGVYSARYSGEDATYESNRKKLLSELKDATDRRAEFRTVICLAASDEEKYFFEGICSGNIIDSEKGNAGFGYDALFVPNGYDKTFAEMNAEMKNEISHRARALDKLISFIEKQNV